ncbi:MAG: hypothetical protein U0836_08215 [Pirellulales bacterium]
MHARLLLDPPAGGAWNMAVDEALIDAAAAEGAPLVLRFYAWTPATLSLGYFQQAAERMHHRPSLRCPLVRRASGGGAIVHDRELTYSLVVPAGHRLARETAGLYRALHGALAEVLAEWGVVGKMFRCGECEVEGDADVDQGHAPHPSPLPQGEGARRVSPLPVGEGPGVRDGDAAKPVNPRATPDTFLCFQRRGEGDLVVTGAKIAGSAQRRRHGAVLQHGSVLLARSEAAPELPGLAELADQTIDADQLRERWLARLAAQLELEFAPSALTDAERETAVELQRAKYSAAEWTYRR